MTDSSTIFRNKITTKNISLYHFFIFFFLVSINKIADETFEDLHSLEWLKLWNNELVSLSYSLMEPVLDTLKHLDIHSKYICHSRQRDEGPAHVPR